MAGGVDDLRPHEQAADDEAEVHQVVPVRRCGVPPRRGAGCARRRGRSTHTDVADTRAEQEAEQPSQPADAGERREQVAREEEHRQRPAYGEQRQRRPQGRRAGRVGACARSGGSSHRSRRWGRRSRARSRARPPRTAGIRVHGARSARRRRRRRQPWRKKPIATMPPPITTGWNDHARHRFSVASTAAQANATCTARAAALPERTLPPCACARPRRARFPPSGSGRRAG